MPLSPVNCAHVRLLGLVLRCARAWTQPTRIAVILRRAKPRSLANTPAYPGTVARDNLRFLAIGASAQFVRRKRPERPSLPRGAFCMLLARVFVPQEALEAWLSLAARAHGRRDAVRRRPVVRAGGRAAFRDRGRGRRRTSTSSSASVKTMEQLGELGGEHVSASVVLGDNAYEVIEGFLARAEPSPSRPDHPRPARRALRTAMKQLSYPIHLNLTGRRVLVAGAGRVATRKIERLVEAERDVSLWWPLAASATVERLAGDQKLTLAEPARGPGRATRAGCCWCCAPPTMARPTDGWPRLRGPRRAGVARGRAR